MAALATVADLEALLGRSLTTEEQNNATELLDSASEAVRDAAGQTFTRATSTVVLPVSDGTRLQLPQRPVVSVDAVTIDGTAATGWYYVAGELTRPGGWGRGRVPGRIVVTYTHGYVMVPRPVRDLVATLALAAMGRLAAGAPDVKQESISGDSYAVTYGRAEDATISPFELPQRTRTWLRETYGHGSVQVAVTR